MEISTFKDKSNSTPHRQPLATYTCTQDHLYRCTHTHTHPCTHRYVHTSTHKHLCMCTHGHAHTPQKNWKAQSQRPFVSLLHNVCFPTLSHQGSSAPTRGVHGLDEAESPHLNSSVQVHLLGGNLQAHRQRLFIH